MRNDMKRISIIVLVLSLLLSPVSLALSSNTDWSLLRSISSGQTVLVKTFSGKSLKGPFLRATDSALELNVNGDRIELQSAEVSRVYVLRGRQFVKGTLIGTAVGTGAGAGLGAIAGRGHDGKGFDLFGQGFYVAIGAGLGLVAGSLAGLAIGASRHKKELVYQAVK
jgi:hypothetical protein